MTFFDVDAYGSIAELSPLAGGMAPTGETVYAKSRADAQELFNRYRNGDRWLKKREVEINGEIYYDVICAEGGTAIGHWMNIECQQEFFEKVKKFEVAVLTTTETCSVCGRWTKFVGHKSNVDDNFCPYCGARMGEEKVERRPEK